MTDIDRKLLEVLVCPQTREPLTFDPERHEMLSPKARLAYPVRDGVPYLDTALARDMEPDE